MNQSVPAVETIDFPSLPAPLAEKYPVGDLNFRLFGTEKEDLAVDFSQTDLPLLVTQILARCVVSQTENFPERFFWEMSVGKRLEYLLRLAAGEKASGFSFPFKCGSCGQQLELELSLQEIAEQQNAADQSEIVTVETGAAEFIFRKPLGRDQQIWQEQFFADEQATKRQIIGSLQIFPDEISALDDEVVPVIEEALDEADPLVNFNCRVNCFECAAPMQFQTDLCAFALGELRRFQWRLLYSAHRLASHYHWSESEIFAVPHWRRLQYLALIADKK